MRRHIFYRAMTKTGEDVKFAGNVNTDGKTPAEELVTESQAQHLGCFAGGMVAIGSKMFSIETDLQLARQLVEGCVWAYEVSPLGVMPEIIHTVPCDNQEKCPWDEAKWHAKIQQHFDGAGSVADEIKNKNLRPGISKVQDKRYILR